MCHQVIEKSLKGYYTSINPELVPYTHNLVQLAKQSGLYYHMSDDQLNIIDLLEPLNIQARYPSDKDKLLKSLSLKRCSEIITETEALFQWIKAKL